MKTIELVFFDIYNQKHILKVPFSLKDELFSKGIKIDASDILGLMFVCDDDFILKPANNQPFENNIYLCQVFDTNGNLLQNIKNKWFKEIKQKALQWRHFTIPTQKGFEFTNLKSKAI
ncbi:MAG: hypothetical protein HPY79_04100 [Bacteroidales bacterium]|nr:hypothetical protein [Bacteroidales bacterium]